jgi:hypothetical protein
MNEPDDPMAEQIAARTKDLAYERLQPAGSVSHIAMEESGPPAIARGGTGYTGMGSLEYDPAADDALSAAGARRPVEPIVKAQGLPTIGDVVQSNMSNIGKGGIRLPPPEQDRTVRDIVAQGKARGFTLEQIERAIDRYYANVAIRGAGAKGDYMTMLRGSNPQAFRSAPDYSQQGTTGTEPERRAGE